MHTTSAFGVVFAIIAIGNCDTAADPNAPDERDRFLRSVRELEASPYSESAPSQLAWAIQFVKDAPDIKVIIHEKYLGELMKSNAPDRHILLGQFIIGEAAFIIEHPERAKMDVECTVAAFSSSLHVYRKAVEHDSKNRIAFFEKLNDAERRGELPSLVERLAARQPVNPDNMK